MRATAKGEIMSLRFLLIAALPLLPLTAQAADVPKEGSANYTANNVHTYSASMKLGDHLAWLEDVSGILRNDDGGVMFNNFGQRCFIVGGMVTGEGSWGQGTCIMSDKDGDQIFLNWQGKQGVTGVVTFAAGSGKYVGISGGGEYTYEQVKSPEDRGLGVVHHKVHWKLP